MILERENLHFVSENFEKKVSSIKQVKIGTNYPVLTALKRFYTVKQFNTKSKRL